MPHGGGEGVEAPPVEAPRLGPGINVRLEQDLVRVDVPDPRDHSLIQQRRLDAASLPSQDLAQVSLSQSRIEGVQRQPTPPHKRVGIRDQRYLSKLPLRVVRQVESIREMDEQARMGREGPGTVTIGEGPGHPEVEG